MVKELFNYQKKNTDKSSKSKCHCKIISISNISMFMFTYFRNSISYACKLDFFFHLYSFFVFLAFLKTFFLAVPASNFHIGRIINVFLFFITSFKGFCCSSSNGHLRMVSKESNFSLSPVKSA